MSLRDNIISTAGDNERLLKIISETDYAPSALLQSNTYIANLKSQIASQEKSLKETDRKVSYETKDHRNYADSHVKRLAYRIGGKKEKFEEKVSKEEKHWVELVQKQIEHKNQLETLNKQLAEATSTSAELDKQASKFTQAQRELDHLYTSIFEGPTAEIPGEDLKESAAKQAAAHFDEVRGRLDGEKQVRNILGEAARFMRNALVDVEDARSSAKADAFGFGGTFMEMHERNCVSRVQQHMGQVQMLLSNARMIQPQVGDIGEVFHAKNGFVMDVVFDNIFTDVDNYEKIKKSKASIEKADVKLKEIIQASEERLKRLRDESRNAKESVDAKRAELQDFRANAFRRIAGTAAPVNGAREPEQASENEGGAPPPEYTPDYKP